MYQVLLTHLRGFRAGQTQQVEAGPDTVISFGRDTEGSTVGFDPDQDDLASRRHARIVWDTGSPSGFSIEDLGSSNGTYLDGRCLTGRAFLQSGQVMEFGRKGEERGPAVRFEVNSPGGGRRAPAPTKIGMPSEPRSQGSPARSPAFMVPKTTDQRASGTGTPKWTLAIAAAAALVLAGGGFFLWKQTREKQPVAATGADVVGPNMQTLVSVDVAWKLYDPVTGRQAYHWHVANPFVDNGLEGTLQGRERVPVFVKLKDGSIEPVIMLSDERDTNLAMGGSHAGTGFVAHRSGFILTSRTLAAPWRETYTWPAVSTPALLVEPGQGDLHVLQTAPRWIPSHARFVLSKPLPLEALQKAKVEGRSSALDGRLDQLTVGFAGSPHRITATLASVSETEPIALLKVNQVNALPECPLRTGETDPAFRETVRILTWGGQGGRGANARPPTVINLSIAAPPSREAETAAQCKECFWLSEGASSIGNIGAPVFDAGGKVAAVFQTVQVADQVVAFATPIRFGIRMMGAAH